MTPTSIPETEQLANELLVRFRGYYVIRVQGRAFQTATHAQLLRAASYIEDRYFDGQAVTVASSFGHRPHRVEWSEDRGYMLVPID